jgi:hypothetical protein
LKSRRVEEGKPERKTADFCYTLRKTFPRRGINTEISPLRYAPVEMTKGRAALTEREVAE